jgi:voltage-gated potassium channel Kch
MRNLSENNNFAYLTVSLVVLLLVAALVDQFSVRHGQQLVQAFTVITLLSGTIGFRNSRLRFRTGLGAIVAVVMVVLLGILLDESGMHYLHLAILTGFYLWATWVAATQVLFSGQVDRNKIIGAICIYLLLGLIWTLVYLGIAQAVPGAFNGLEQAPWYENFSAVAYYSYVTLTTLGYGDISPVVPVARFLVYMEAIAGVFYMATLVASLIGIRLADIQAGNK